VTEHSSGIVHEEGCFESLAESSLSLKSPKFFSVPAIECIEIFDDHFHVFPFYFSLVILSLDTVYPELQTVSFHLQL
jgi:hypothetical protein